jgi:hypothetical protein
MNSLIVRSLDRTVFRTLAVLLVMSACSLSVWPHQAHASAVSISGGFTATSTNVYVNTGFATSTRVATGDAVNFQLNLSGTPWVTPQINLFGMGSTSFTGGSGAHWVYATTTTSAWTEGLLSFLVSVGGTAVTDNATTTLTAANLTGTNVTYDKTGPTLSSVSWSDVDGSTEFSPTDTLTFTFSETMATSTITTSNVDTVLGLSNSHTFGTTPTVAWNTAGTVLTLTLGTGTTVANADTVNPTSAVKDAVGNAAASSPATIVDNIAPLAVTGNTGAVFHGSTTVTLASVGSSQIRYTTDGTTPTCSVGTVYSSPITISNSEILSAIGCDEASNATTVVTASYSTASGGGGSSGGGSVSTPPAVTTPAPTTATSTTATTTTQTSNPTGLSDGQIQAIIALLTSFGGVDQTIINNVNASLHGSVSSPSSTSSNQNPLISFTQDLSLGSIGAEVQSLQMFLNTHNYQVAATGPGSSGNETTKFGLLTQSALAKFQKASGISPAFGYFGPKTRAYITTLAQ